MRTKTQRSSFRAGFFRTHPIRKTRSRKARWAGFTLVETLGVLALALLVSGISVWTWQSLASRQRQYPLTEERVHRFRDELVTAHLRAQQGEPQEISLNKPELNIDGGPQTIAFLPPYGRLGQAHSIRFWVGENDSWWQFDVAPDGMVMCQPGSRPMQMLGRSLDGEN